MIVPADIPGVDEDVARRIIVAARSIAPCIDSFPDDSEQKKDAIAVLRGVAAEVPKAGSRRVKSQRIGPASVEYWNTDTWANEDRTALRALCSPSPVAGIPMGSFPKAGVVGRIWPEGEYS